MPARELSHKFHPLEIQVRKTLQSHKMLAPAESVLVAVSGGADSVALLLCLHKLAPELNLALSVAHLNHGIRGPEGDADEEFVRHISENLQLPFYSETIRVKQQAETIGKNLEELARQRRYEFLQRTARRIGAGKIAVGHTLNDQAETILFRLLRGSGIEGLSAIHPIVAGLVIRPLLESSRDSILDYLKQRGSSHREDSTNKDLQYARNRIRLDLLPYLRKHFNPQVVSTLAQEAFLTREAWSFIEAEAMRAFENLDCRRREGIVLDICGLLELHPVLQKEVLRRALAESLGSLRGITHRHIDSLLLLCTTGCSGDQIQLPQGNTAIRQFHNLLLMTHPVETEPSYIYRLDVPGECRIVETGAWIRATICGTPDLTTRKEHLFRLAYLEASSLPGFLTVRTRMPGDRYGGPGHRKVKKMLIDGKVPSLQRPALPMVVAGNDVIWMPGFRPARAFEVHPESRTCVAVEVIPEPNKNARL
jgi:tRNA(Ile)-lysidine synthase